MGLEVNADDATLSVDTAIPCGLIINELISNCLKHAFRDGRPGRIEVEFRAGDTYLLRVADDGVGLPEGFDIARSESLGLQLANTLTDQLDGEVQVANNRGASFTITFRASTDGESE